MRSNGRVKPLSRQAYKQIRRKIVSLDLPPGVVIDEGALREELDLGRTPIREALQRLALEKLVTIVPRRGMFVTEIGITDLQRLCEVRIESEALAAELAAKRGRATHWAQMRELLDDLDRVPDNQLIDVDEACHRLIYEAADNEFLEHNLLTLYALSLRMWHFALSHVDDMVTAVSEHQTMLSAFEAGDAAEARRLMTEHVRAFQTEIQTVLVGRQMDGAG